MLSKCGAIFEVSPELIVQGLKAIGALPEDGECQVAVQYPTGHTGTPAFVLVKVMDPDGETLPVVPEGAVYPRRKAVAGCPKGA